MNHSCAVLMVLALLALGARSAADDEPATVDVDALLASFANMEGLEARFVEEKRLALLKGVLRSEGRLFFAPPGYLLRRIDAPQPSKVLITPSRLVVEDAGRREVIDLRSRPEARSFVSSFVSLLSGDKAALEAAYRITSAREPTGGWVLELTPKAPPLSDIIRRVEIIGVGRAVSEVGVFDTNGDQTTTRMLEVDPKRSFDASERKALFGITEP